jgi:hypothetical protein
MALSDLAVFSEQLYSTTTEVLAQQVELFNAATDGGLILSAQPFSGDYSETAFFAKVSGLVRRRNPYATGAVAAKSLEHLIDVMVKVAAGTPPLEMDPGQFRWLQQNPELAAATYAQQLARDTLADMLNVSVGSLVAALSAQAAVVYDATALTPDTMTQRTLNRGAQKMGDMSGEIRCWLMHSTPMFDLFDNALTNAEQLFNYGNVNIVSDPFGRRFCITDCPALVDTVATPDVYNTIGLTAGAAIVSQNGDYDSNVETKNGDENLLRTMQAEWSYSVGIKGFAWDKTNGGKAPTDTALFTSTNWDRIATSHKDLAGVLVKTN